MKRLRHGHGSHGPAGPARRSSPSPSPLPEPLAFEAGEAGSNLQRIVTADLLVLAGGGVPQNCQARVADGALLPAFVARRALELQQQPGAGPLAGAVYWIAHHGLIAGSCGFKDAAEDGWVEIGYAVAPSCQRQGLGTRGVSALCRIAFAHSGIDFVRACIEPGNAASAALAAKLGFVPGFCVAEEDGTQVQVWTLTRQAALGREC